MTKKFTLLLFLLCIFSFSAFAQTVLQGSVKDQNGDPVIGATVVLFKSDVQIKGAASDFDGNYIITNVDPGTYDVQVSSLGLGIKKYQGVQIKNDQTTKLNIELSEEGSVLDEVEIVAYRVPLIDFDQTSSGNTVTAESIAKSPLKNVAAIAATSGGLTTDASGNISVRGSRSNATNYYVDGMRVAGGLIPAAEIEQLQVITGGLAAKYGDVTGGVISLTSKGPSEKYSFGFEAETSQFLDPYGFNFLNGNISGPLLKNKEGQSILGFRFNAQYVSRLDNSPSAVGVYRMPESVIQDLEANPTYMVNGTAFPRGELLGLETLNSTQKVRPNEEQWEFNLVGKIDARISDNIDLSVSGIYGRDKDRFTPGGGWGLLNWTRNPYNYGENYRINARWRHKIGQQGLPESKDELGGNTVLRNANYTLQVGVENNSGFREDLIHQDNFFNYGLYGTQEIISNPAAGQVDTSEWGGAGAVQINAAQFIDHVTFTQERSPFNPMIDPENGVMSPNPVLSRYQSVNGRLLGATTDIWNSSFFDNVGRVFNNYRKFDSDRNTVNFDAQLDILPGGSIDNRHNIQFGGMYEFRVNRFWSIAPQELWTMARDAANSHILAGVDTTSFSGETFTSGVPWPALEFQAYSRNIEEDTQKKFYKAIREKHNLGLDDFVNVDGTMVVNGGLSLDMFSASELINWNDLGLNYYGYDVYGNEANGGSFDDFFNTYNADSVRTFPVAADQPVYIAGYIQDKFTYEDIILRVGIRADYFDANTKVLKDKYSLYTIETAQQFSERRDEQFPSTVDPNAKVYLSGTDRDDSAVKAYRVEDDWFAPDGTKTDPQLLFGTEQVQPSYLFSEDENNIKDPNFKPEQSFEDYAPSFKVTPRISLSFPISEDAGFFAHYDQLVQRPPSNTVFTALDYFFFEEISRLNPGGAAANNPNLRPETTIDYEVGFQQKLTQSSALKIAAYYRENRDLIQTRFLLNVPIVNNYLTYDNIDFGTVKGFTATYDLRRTGNIEMSASYTLQYAEGTGSSANSGLSSRNGEVRVLIPLAFDERHRLVGNIDYRYASGEKYNGPTIQGLDIFANAGINFQVAAISGRPYTKLANINTPFAGSGFTGELNGARLPWNFNIDARIDKNFNFKFTEKSQRGLNLNVYLRISNLLDTRNVVGVYRVTGSPDDDGFLNSSFGASAVQNIEDTGKDLESYLAAYQWALLNPGFYSLPRRIRLGAIVNF